MIVAMQDSATEDQIQQVIAHLVKMGFEVHRSTGARQTVLGAVGAQVEFDIRNLEMLPGVQDVHRISSPYKLAGRSFRPEGKVAGGPLSILWLNTMQFAYEGRHVTATFGGRWCQCYQHRYPRIGNDDSGLGRTGC